MNQNSDKLETKNEKETVNWKSELISWIQIIIAAAVIALFLNSCIIANSQIPSESMENTIMAHDRVIGSRLSYLFSEPERGDVIIFHYPDDPTGDTYYVKRVIGLPGDVIDIHDGGVYLNGSDTPLDEPYIKEPMETDPNHPLHFEVPEDSYFMMGDNRNDSWDARFWENTWVTKDKLIAKVLFRYYPFNKMGVIH